MNQNSNKLIGNREIFNAVMYIIWSLITLNSSLGLGFYSLVMFFDGDFSPLELFMFITTFALSVIVGVLSIISLNKRNRIEYLKFKLIINIITEKQLKLYAFILTWMSWAVNDYDFDKYFLENMLSMVWLYIVFMVIYILNDKSRHTIFKNIKEVMSNDIEQK